MEYGAVFLVLVGVFFGIVESTCVGPHETEQGKANETSQNSANHDITHGCCLSDACLKAATKIRNDMDQNTEPCADFYQFACGGHSNWSLESDYAVDRIRLILSDYKQRMYMKYEAEIGAYQPRHFRLAKNLYDSCMNTSRIEVEGSAPLQNILKKLGGWPVLVRFGWNPDDFDITKANAKIINAGYPGYKIIKAGVYIDTYHNFTKYPFYLSNSDSGLPYGWPLKTVSNFKDYYNYMIDIALYLGANRQWASELLIECLYLQIDLHYLVQPLKPNREREHSFTTVGQLVKEYPRIEWKEYFAPLLPSNAVISDEDVVAVHRDCNLTALYKVTERYSKTVIATYMLWRVIDHSIVYLDEQVRNQYYGLRERSYEYEPRWLMCVSEVIESLPMSARALSGRGSFHIAGKYEAADITSSIKTTIKKNIEKVDWLDSSMKIRILEKIDSLILLTPHPDEFLNDTEVNSYYQSLELTGGNYLESSLNVSLFKMRKRQVRFSSDNDKWKNIGIAADITEMDLPDLNDKFLSEDVYQGIHLSFEQPNYMNYGGIGSAIGREIIQGIQYWRPLKSSGNLQCIVDQYNNYSSRLSENNTGGKLKIEKNIVDDVGCEQSYHAYIAWAAANEPEEAMPGLPYTPRQMFWITFANTFCSELSLAEVNHFLTYRGHIESDFRVNGPLSNSVEFSKDFNCPVGSRMNPVNKCSFM